MGEGNNLHIRYYTSNLALHIYLRSDFRDDAQEGGMRTKTGEFRLSGITDNVLYRKGVFNYIKYNVTFGPHKTRG